MNLWSIDGSGLLVDFPQSWPTAAVQPEHLLQAAQAERRHGRMIKQANNYLKWAFIVAANVVVMRRNHPNWRRKHNLC